MSKTEKTPKQRSLRIMRGGGWFWGPQYARVRRRNFCFTPGNRDVVLGVRLVEVLDEQD